MCTPLTPTLLCVSLLQGQPVAQKAIVVAPATLVANWCGRLQHAERQHTHVWPGA